MRCQSFAKNVNNFYCILSSCSASSSISLRMSRAAITTWCSSSSLTTVLEHGPALGELDLRLRCSRFVIRYQEISAQCKLTADFLCREPKMTADQSELINKLSYIQSTNEKAEAYFKIIIREMSSPKPKPKVKSSDLYDLVVLV